MKPRVKKPDWLKIKIGGEGSFLQTKKIVEEKGLHTICSSGKCPNIGECWAMGTATFMISGDICTRKCKFCNTLSGRPLPLDFDEPRKVADSIKEMALKHAVITSVDRDDLSDYGANHWCRTIETVRQINPDITIEVLLPDFNGNTILVDSVCAVRPDIIAHNMETVKRLTPHVRSVAKYDVSLSVLERFAKNGLVSKSGFMLGMGETQEEVIELLKDLISVNCKRITIGQYLQPTSKHLPVTEYIHPDVFAELKILAYDMGFEHVESGSLVRSSYHAKSV